MLNISNDSNFNSIKVQLKLNHNEAELAYNRNFNSIKVQLKLKPLVQSISAV